VPFSSLPPLCLQFCHSSAPYQEDQELAAALQPLRQWSQFRAFMKRTFPPPATLPGRSSGSSGGGGGNGSGSGSPRGVLEHSPGQLRISKDSRVRDKRQSRVRDKRQSPAPGPSAAAVGADSAEVHKPLWASTFTRGLYLTGGLAALVCECCWELTTFAPQRWGSRGITGLVWLLGITAKHPWHV